MTPESLARLRATLSKAPREETRVPLGHAAADACLKGGLTRGALHEVFAEAGHEGAATGFAVGLVARLAAKKPVLWIRQDFSALEFGELAATGLLELGLDPRRFLLLHAAQAEDALRAASDALSCTALGAVVIEVVGAPKGLDLKGTRRLTLLAAETGVGAVLLRFSAAPDASSAETRWLIRAAPSREEESWGQPVFEAGLVRNRHGSMGHWVMEWNCDEGCFRPPSRGAVVPEACDRPAAAAAQTQGRSAA